MTAETMEDRFERLESKLQVLEERLAEQKMLAEQLGKAEPPKKGWRRFVGVDADNPHFEEAVRLGQEWRYTDRPQDDKEQA